MRSFRLGLMAGIVFAATLCGCAITPPPPVPAPAPPVVEDGTVKPKPNPAPAGAVSRATLDALVGKTEAEVAQVLGTPFDAYTQPRSPGHRVVSWRIVLAGDGPRFAHVHFAGGKALPIDPR